MFPSIWPRDEIDLASSGELTTDSGEVVAFVASDGTMVAHRLLGRCARTHTLLTQGDLILRSDEAIPREAFAGRVVRVRRTLWGRSFVVPDLLWRRRWLPRICNRCGFELSVRLKSFLQRRLIGVNLSCERQS